MSDQRTVQDRETALVQYLYSCRPEMLERTTLDRLEAIHGGKRGVARKRIEYLWVIAKQKRAPANG